MSFGQSQSEKDASAYQQKYTGNLDQSQQFGTSIINQGLGMFNQQMNDQNGYLGGQNFLKQYSSQLGGLETSNSTMNSIAQRLMSMNTDVSNQGALENLALQNQAGDAELQATLGARGLSGMGGAGLSALSQYRTNSNKTYADATRANQLQSQQMQLQGLGQAGQLLGQIGQNQSGLLSLLGQLDTQKAGINQGGLQALLGLGGNIYGGALGGMGTLNGQMQQTAQANAAGRGQGLGGLIQGGLGLAGTLLGGPVGGALGGMLGGLFGGGGGGNTGGSSGFGVSGSPSSYQPIKWP